MSTGKYSPLRPHANEPGWDMFKFNCYGEVPAEWNQTIHDSGAKYDEKTMFDGYDDEGFDRYGYSAFEADGNYVGCGNGVDRYGYTEMDYLQDSINGGDLHSDVRYSTPMTAFVRKR
jgi:hypothetical protein